MDSSHRARHHRHRRIRQARQDELVAEAQKLRERMVAALAQQGELDERWRAALTEVPRHAFILTWCGARTATRWVTVTWCRCAGLTTRTRG
jgi:hypothetical protein